MGAFQFSTANLPIDCVGQLSDGVSTIPVVIFGCTTEQVVSGGGVLKTGQTFCVDSVGDGITCAGTGQDGELQKGIARSYTSNAEGTITDNVTGLVWEKLTADATIHDFNNLYTWPQAFQKIADLNTANFAGHNDWRLPNINELQTLADYSRSNPAIDPLFFFNDPSSFIKSDFYWSSTTWAIAPLTRAFALNFSRGSADAFNKEPILHFVRAVRGGS